MSGDATPAIVAHHLGKRYGSRVALAGVSFEVAEGEIFGLLGPNGAGKTTTLRILTGRSRPTSGCASVMGLDVVRRRDDVTALIGVVFEEPNLYERTSGRANLRLFSDLYGLPCAGVDEVLQLVDLSPADASRRVRTYSTGMRQRLLIARALLNRPRVLVLDEPTRGLDPITARELRGLIGQLSRGGTTILLATHVLDEVDALCNRVLFLREGQLVTVASPQALKLQRSTHAATVVLDDAEERLVELSGADSARQLAGWMTEGRVRAIHSQEARLEDVFVRLAHTSAEPQAHEDVSTPTINPEPGLIAARTTPTAHTAVSLRRWSHVVSRLVREELGGTLRNGQWLILTLLLLLAGSCGVLGPNSEPSVVHVAYAPDGPTHLPDRLAERVAPSIQLEFIGLASADEVRQAVQQQRAAFGLILPERLDATVQAGAQSMVTIVRRTATDSSTAWISPAVGAAVQDLTGRPGAALVAQEIQPPGSTGILGAAERLGTVELLAGVALLLLPTLIGTMIVPALLHEEVDKKTLSALLLVARPAQVIAGKGLTGLAYLATMVPIAVVVSGLRPAEPLTVAAAMGVFGIWLIEAGLVLGLVVERRTYEQAGPLAALIVLLLPAVLAVGMGSNGATVLAMLWPPAAAAWLLLDGLTGVDLFTASPWAILVLLGWVIGTYLILVEIVRRREL